MTLHSSRNLRNMIGRCSAAATHNIDQLGLAVLGHNVCHFRRGQIVLTKLIREPCIRVCRNMRIGNTRELS